VQSAKVNYGKMGKADIASTSRFQEMLLRVEQGFASVEKRSKTTTTHSLNWLLN